MYIDQREFQGHMPLPRHFRLFELMRQSNVTADAQHKAQKITEVEMEAFRDIACASLHR